MHRAGHRLNALLTLEVTIMALIFAMASLSDHLTIRSPSANVQVLNINWFQKQPNGNDEVFFFLDAEYETPKNALYLVSLWDGIYHIKNKQSSLLIPIPQTNTNLLIREAIS